MAKYIDVEAAENVIIESTHDMLQDTLLLRLRKIPAADVEEVRHGEWIENKHACGYYMSGYLCSLCNHAETLKKKYCADCGAKMDGNNNTEGENHEKEIHN